MKNELTQRFYAWFDVSSKQNHRFTQLKIRLSFR